MGVYPDVTLRDARERRDEAQRKMANQIDPGEHRKANKNARADAVANSFETVAHEWFTKVLPTWTPDHADKIIKPGARRVPVDRRQAYYRPERPRGADHDPPH